jgi:acyl-coenzyme A thioesterase PaaI-like protein
MLATFLDFALGTCGKIACRDDMPTPTINLTVDYLQPAFAGEWVESRARLVHKTRGMFFVEGSLVTANGVIARANAIYKRVSPVPGR